MNMRINENGTVELDNCRIYRKNFSGTPDQQYNKDGKRSFRIILDDPEIADELASRGWNVREYNDTVYLEVKVDASRTLIAYCTTNDIQRQVFGDEISDFDNIIIESVNVDLRPSGWVDRATGEKKFSAWLSAIEVFQKADRFRRAPVAERV